MEKHGQTNTILNVQLFRLFCRAILPFILIQAGCHNPTGPALPKYSAPQDIRQIVPVDSDRQYRYYWFEHNGCIVYEDTIMFRTADTMSLHGLHGFKMIETVSEAPTDSLGYVFASFDSSSLAWIFFSYFHSRIFYSS